jgi:3-oxoacyl-[acyl-carrier protein] reductase
MANILIIGIGGSLGEVFFKGLVEEGNVLYGTSTKRESIANNVFYLDLTNTNSIQSFPNIELDHVIISAGYEPSASLSESTEAHIEKMFRIHVTGPILFLKKIQSQLSNNSSITFISSPAAWQGSYDPSYAAVKGAVNALVRTLAKDMAPHTRVNALSPSLIENSTVFNGMTHDFKQRHIDRTLNKRLLSLDECLQGIKFIIASPHYTGQILHLNGGMIYG